MYVIVNFIHDKTYVLKSYYGQREDLYTEFKELCISPKYIQTASQRIKFDLLPSYINHSNPGIRNNNERVADSNFINNIKKVNGLFDVNILDELIELNVVDYIERYFLKYLLSFSNNINRSGKILIGVTDQGDISGIPYNGNIKILQKIVNTKVTEIVSKNLYGLLDTDESSDDCEIITILGTEHRISKMKGSKNKIICNFYKLSDDGKQKTNLEDNINNYNIQVKKYEKDIIDYVKKKKDIIEYKSIWSMKVAKYGTSENKLLKSDCVRHEFALYLLENNYDELISDRPMLKSLKDSSRSVGGIIVSYEDIEEEFHGVFNEVDEIHDLIDIFVNKYKNNTIIDIDILIDLYCDICRHDKRYLIDFVINDFLIDANIRYVRIIDNVFVAIDVYIKHVRNFKDYKRDELYTQRVKHTKVPPDNIANIGLTKISNFINEYSGNGIQYYLLEIVISTTCPLIYIDGDNIITKYRRLENVRGKMEPFTVSR